jgi:uncharacterized protein (UPF0212 family)
METTPETRERELALTYCPRCGHEFHSAELAEARSTIRALAALRDAQAELLKALRSSLVEVTDA